MGERVMVTSATPIKDALALGDDVYEVLPSRAAVKDAKGETVLDGSGQPATAEVWDIGAQATTLDNAADRAAAIKPRTDLDAAHPYYGYRFASACFSGDSDRVMGVDGEWYPVSAQADLDDLVAAGKVRREVVPPKPVDEKPLEEPIEEVLRVR